MNAKLGTLRAHKKNQQGPTQLSGTTGTTLTQKHCLFFSSAAGRPAARQVAFSVSVACRTLIVPRFASSFSSFCRHRLTQLDSARVVISIFV